MTQISIGRVADLEGVPLQGFTIQGRQILLANLEGTYFALGNLCTHDRCWLSDGRIISGNVQCPCHGSMFSLKTGEAVHRPATDPVPVYNVIIENGEIFIDL
jgi:nitrite reductase/ring-hydroxylating ferredoxin subunit